MNVGLDNYQRDLFYPTQITCLNSELSRFNFRRKGYTIIISNAYNVRGFWYWESSDDLHKSPCLEGFSDREWRSSGVITNGGPKLCNRRSNSLLAVCKKVSTILLGMDDQRLFFLNWPPIHYLNNSKSPTNTSRSQ